MERPLLTVCIIARDEESNIKRALRSALAVASDVVVVDTGSIDKTVEVARSMGARVYLRPWNDDFSEARNAAIEHALGHWILMLDADEAIHAQTAACLEELLNDEAVDGYFVRVVRMETGRPESPVRVLRLFRNRPDYRFTGRVHEQIADSICASGGVLRDSPLILEHYGYTAAEHARKRRRERNTKLLLQEFSARPESVAHWFHLGHEYFMQRELGKAVSVLRHCVEQSPASEWALAARHVLVQVELQRHRLEQGWDLIGTPDSHSDHYRDSLICAAEVALYHGDYLVADQLISQLEAVPAQQYGFFSSTPQYVSHLRALTAWTAGQCQRAVELWQEAYQESPDNVSIATEWVRHLVISEGLRKAVTTALRRHPTPQLAAAVTGALLRARELRLAAELATKYSEWSGHSPYFLHGLALAQKFGKLEEIIGQCDVETTLHVVTAAIWSGNSTLLAAATKGLPDIWQEVVRQLLSGGAINQDFAWAVDLLMCQWADIGCWELLRAVGTHQDTSDAGIGRSAWLLLRAGDAGTAIQWALETPHDPWSLEVLGQVAFDQGDYEAAAHFLTERIRAGAAPVFVYHRAAQSLNKVERLQDALQVLCDGAAAHPWSLLLRTSGRVKPN